MMFSRRKLIAAAASASTLIRPVLAAPRLNVGAGRSYISKFTFQGAPVTRYNDTHANTHGDTMVPTWADDGKLYSAMNDTTGGINGSLASANVCVVSWTGTAPGSILGANVNNMSQFGASSATAGADARSYKTAGTICIGGVLYLATNRTGNDGISGQNGLNCQIIKSTDHGVNWTPLPPSTNFPYVSPTFPGAMFAYPHFFQFGQNYGLAGPHRSLEYVYAMSNRLGLLNSASDTFIVGRCLVANMPNLRGSDWTFYQGGDGMLDRSWGAVSSAADVITKPAGMVLDQPTVMYIPAFGVYVVGSVQYIGDQTVGSYWNFWQSQTPWGPYSLFQQQSWDTTNASPTTGSLYLPQIMPNSLAVGGGDSCTFMACGNWHNVANYTPVLISATIS